MGSGQEAAWGAMHPTHSPAWARGPRECSGRPGSDPDLGLIVGKLLPVLCSIFGEIIQFCPLFVANNENKKTVSSWQLDFLRADGLKIAQNERNLRCTHIHLHILEKFSSWPRGHVDSCVRRHRMAAFS